MRAQKRYRFLIFTRKLSYYLIRDNFAHLAKLLCNISLQHRSINMNFEDNVSAMKSRRKIH